MSSTREVDGSQSDKPKFNNPQDEIDYLKLKLDETQTEFQEFQESSRELEAEYETQIKQLEKKNKDSVNQISRLDDELDQLRTRYNTYTNDTQHKLNEYQKRISEVTSINERLTSYIRELEQGNDDLERARRALAASLEDFEGQLNQQIERNVLLENEISEKEELECVVQRLKEEARDLRHELIVSQNSSDSSKKKELVVDNCLSNLKQNSSIQAQTDPKENTGSSANPEGASTNGRAQSQTPESLIANGSGQHSNLPDVDSTTSPTRTPPQTTTSRFSFSSPFSYSKSSSSKSSKSQQTSTPSSPTLPPIVMTPSSRVSALNIVSDLLKKVGALESKLASSKKVTG